MVLQKLCLDFVAEYGELLPELVFLQVPNGDIWCGRYYKYSFYVDGVHRLMNYYNVKPYFMVRFEYFGDANFSIQIFNEYAVEIDYPLLCRRTLNNQYWESLESTGFNFSDFDLDKLNVISCFNTIDNFVRQYQLEIKFNSKAFEDYYEVLYFQFFNVIFLISYIINKVTTYYLVFMFVDCLCSYK